jgi:hypothetical protein
MKTVIIFSSVICIYFAMIFIRGVYREKRSKTKKKKKKDASPPFAGGGGG